MATTLPSPPFSIRLTVAKMSAALKQAIDESVGVKIVNIPMELRMSCPTTVSFDEFPVKLIGSTATSSFTMALSRARPVVGVDPIEKMPELIAKLQDGNLIQAGPCLGMSADVPIDDFQIAVIPMSDTEVEARLYLALPFLVMQWVIGMSRIGRREEYMPSLGCVSDSRTDT